MLRNVLCWLFALLKLRFFMRKHNVKVHSRCRGSLIALVLCVALVLFVTVTVTGCRCRCRYRRRI